WDARVVVKTGCALGGGVTPMRDDEPFEACLKWRESVAQKLLEWKPALELVAQSPAISIQEAKGGEPRAQLVAQGMRGSPEARTEKGIPVSLIRSTPVIDKDCISEPTIERCKRPRNRALRKLDPVVMATSNRDGVKLVDLTDGIGGPES